MRGPLYNSYSRYLRRKYGETVYRVAVDAGFSCPNRRGRAGPGCTYCAEDGARASYLGSAADVEEQVGRAVAFLKNRYGALSFILYFQAFSGTNAPVRRLESLYATALATAPFRELVVSTRPDCVDAEKAKLLCSFRTDQRDVWVELGLQSANDTTLERISRGHTVAQFVSAYAILKSLSLKVAVHVIFGLPGEEDADMEATVRLVAGLDPDGVKINNLHIPHSTPLADEYRKGEVTAPGPETHLERVIRALEILPARCLIMRLTTDTPKDRLLAPRVFWNKQEFAARLAAAMEERRTWQGRLSP